LFDDEDDEVVVIHDHCIEIDEDDDKYVKY
jgi:hypothetical protein